jgi:hypothetical protein
MFYTTENNMLNSLFSFTDPILDTDENDMFLFLVKIAEEYFDVIGKSGRDRAKSLPEGVNLKAGMPLDIALSLLRPDELEKLRNYVTAYLAKHDISQA